MNTNQYTRRRALQDTLKLFGAGGAAWIASSVMQGSELPIKTSGLEHIGMQVPDQEAAAKFYGRIFDPQLFQERDPPPRFYVKIGISYIAFGGLPAGVTTPRIDHFCAVGLDYKGQEMRKSLDEAGVPMTGQGALGMAADPDGLPVDTLDDERFLVVNGVQTLAYACTNLIMDLDDLAQADIASLRLSPQHCDMVAVASTFREVLDGKMPAEEGLRELTAIYPDVPTTNNFLRARATTAQAPHGISIA